jgi:hypothetical protein
VVIDELLHTDLLGDQSAGWGHTFPGNSLNVQDTFTDELRLMNSE